MIDPTKHRQLEELDTVNLCTQIFTNARNELYLCSDFDAHGPADPVIYFS